MLTDYYRFYRQSWPLLSFGFLAIFWGNLGQSFFVSWFGADIQQQLGLSAGEYGSAYSLATLASGTLLMWAGQWIDRISLNRFLVLTSTGLFIACLTLWQSHSIVVLSLGFFLIRFFGQGLLPHGSITTMAKNYSTNRGKSISIANTANSLGTIILPMLAVYLLSVFSWQQSWLLLSLTIPLLFVPLSVWLIHQSKKEGYQEPVSSIELTKEVVQGSRRTLLKDNRFWFALPAILAAPFIVTGLFLQQNFLLQSLSWSKGTFALSVAVYGGVIWITSMKTGSLVDKHGSTKLLQLFPVPMLLAMLAPIFLTGNWTAFVLMSLLGVCIGLQSPIVASLWAEIYGTKNLGAIKGMISAIGVLSTAASPALFGFLIDAGMTVTQFFWLLSGYMVVAIVLLRFSYRPAE
jgi:MFS family permease